MGKKYSESLFGDARLDNAFRVLVARLVVRYSLVIRQLANNEGEERRFSRFINNSSVGPKSLVDQWNQLNDGEVGH